MRMVAALVAVAVLALFAADAAAQSAPCVNQTDALIKARDNVIASLKQFWFARCSLTFSCISGVADTEVANSDTIKRLNAEVASWGNQCLETSKKEAAELAKSLPNCRVAPDGPTTIQCASPASFELCRKAKPWSPGSCHIWNGQPMAPCCKLYSWQ